MLCRLNSTEDRNFGAARFEQIEPNYSLVNGQPKRFFDKSAVRRMFADGWNPSRLMHISTNKYQQPKAARKSFWSESGDSLPDEVLALRVRSMDLGGNDG